MTDPSVRDEGMGAVAVEPVIVRVTQLGREVRAALRAMETPDADA